MPDIKETCVDYLDVDNHAVFSSAERKRINKILKLKETHPDEVTIRHYPDKNDGIIIADIPKSWLKISPPAKRKITDEQREIMTKRLAEAREKRNS